MTSDLGGSPPCHGDDDNEDDDLDDDDDDNEDDDEDDGSKEVLCLRIMILIPIMTKMIIIFTMTRQE